MDKVTLRIFTSETQGSGRPYQALLNYEFDDEKDKDKKFDFEISKVDENGNIIEKEARFSLYKKLGNGQKCEVMDSKVATQDGKIKFLGLEAGEYLLYDDKAPDGYEKLKEPYEIKIG